jgi:UV DNA damage endonuclease
MSIGYACLAVAVPGSELKNCILKNATKDHLLSLIGQNLDSLDKLIDYNVQNGISLFRISSDLIPFGSSVAAEIQWQILYAEKLSVIGNKINQARMRVSMHPGQYTVLNSPDKLVAARAMEDLNYHTNVLDCMGLGSEHKIILHLGGAYGDKIQAKNRFISRYNELDCNVRKRLVLENDDISFNIIDVLETSSIAEIPVVYDNLHNAVNPADTRMSDIDWIQKCAATWDKSDGLQKVHYSQQNNLKKPGAHSETICIDKFMEYYQQLKGMNIDIMLEVKDKNISALKCINCVSSRGISMLEVEWARYKYFVLERSPETYNKIRQLLRDKNSYPALEMYRMIETVSDMPVVTGNAVNAAQHVWGYFKDKVSEVEKKRFERILAKFSTGDKELKSVKNNLLQLSRKYNEDYLLNGYYLYK